LSSGFTNCIYFFCFSSSILGVSIWFNVIFVKNTSWLVEFLISKDEIVYLGICNGYTLYSFYIKQKDITFIIDKIKEKNAAKSSELFDLSFKKLSTIKQLLSKYNKISIKSINKFIKYFNKLPVRSTALNYK
jgi:hypothetical protein